MDQDISKIIQALAEQESKLQTELDETNCKATLCADRLAQVQNALSALRRIGQPKHAKTDLKAGRKGASQATIEDAVVGILTQYGSLTKPEILQHVKSKLLSQGQSRVGLKAMFAKVIASPRFKLDQNQSVTIR